MQSSTVRYGVPLELHNEADNTTTHGPVAKSYYRSGPPRTDDVMTITNHKHNPNQTTYISTQSHQLDDLDTKVCSLIALETLDMLEKRFEVIISGSHRNRTI